MTLFPLGLYMPLMFSLRVILILSMGDGYYALISNKVKKKKKKH